VQVSVTSDPGTLLAAGPRRWALATASGEVEVRSAGAGEGVLVVAVEASMVDEGQPGVRRSRSRHDLTVRAEQGTEPSPGPAMPQALATQALPTGE
jgi:hypothetical protein